MPSSAPRSEVERHRHRLNTLAMAVPGQFLPLIAIYWLRFVPAFRPFQFEAPFPPPWMLLICAAGLLVPFVLPRAYFKPRSFERGGFYPALGLRWFRAVAPDGGWINRRLRRMDPSYRVIRNRRTRTEHLAGSITNERWHTSWLLLGLVTLGSALHTRQFGWAVAVTVFNVAFNLYPVLHQRYKRARVRHEAV
jgi:Glycosyl-4,4'-diaponeurosporenoate acyltransferase